MNRERLKTGLDRMGIAADETALERFEAFHAILDEYNARMDLTAVLDEDERVDRHDVRKPELYAGQRQQRREKGLQIGERERQRGKHGAGRDSFR